MDEFLIWIYSDFFHKKLPNFSPWTIRYVMEIFLWISLETPHSFRTILIFFISFNVIRLFSKNFIFLPRKNFRTFTFIVYLKMNAWIIVGRQTFVFRTKLFSIHQMAIVDCSQQFGRFSFFVMKLKLFYKILATEPIKRIKYEIQFKTFNDPIRDIGLNCPLFFEKSRAMDETRLKFQQHFRKFS